jgi:hypothetical protein
MAVDSAIPADVVDEIRTAIGATTPARSTWRAERLTGAG